MVSLDTPPVLPLQLLFESAPTVDELRAQIEHWVIYHLRRTAESDVHYENYLYGPIASFLASIFPIRRRYMIIPQAILRRAMNEDEVARHRPNVSIGSTGGFHEARDFGGTEQLKQFPDFVVVKVTPQPGIERHHRIICIIEIKRDDETEIKAVTQMETYMKRAADLPWRVEGLRGYLVMGSSLLRFWLQDHENGAWVWQDKLKFGMFDEGDPFTRELCEISTYSWNYQS